MISASIDYGKIFAGLDRLAANMQKAIRPAAQAGAQVFYEEVRMRAPVSKKEHSTKGKKQTYQPGNLRDSIYQAFADKDSVDGYAVYRISWSKKKAFYGRFVEFGTSKTAARPFLRPAYDAARERALKASMDVLRAAAQAATV